MTVWIAFLLAFSALLPIINPLGSALVFLGVVGSAPPALYRSLARRIAINNVLFLGACDGRKTNLRAKRLEISRSQSETLLSFHISDYFRTRNARYDAHAFAPTYRAANSAQICSVILEYLPQ